MDAPTFSDFKRQAALFDHEVFTGDLQLNIVGWRAYYGYGGTFEDLLVLYWEENGREKQKSYLITTLPGEPFLRNPINPAGTAILVPGQYRNTYALGMYKSYTALKQIRPVKVYRDDNYDGIVNPNPRNIQEGLFGIHIHRAGWASKIIGVSSAGCQVFSKRLEFEEFIEFCVRSASVYGNEFTYTLMEEM